MKNIIIYHIFIFVFLFSFKTFANENQDTIFESDAVIYDKNTGKFVTEGEVNIDYKDNNLVTEKIEYDTVTKNITAENKIDIKNSNTKIDTQNLILNTENETMSLGNMNVEFGKNSYAKAESATMPSQDKLILNDIEYTACKEGLNNCDNAPSWKIGASKITHNNETGSLFFTNAMLYMWDFPILYLPILQTYAPNIENKSGLLIPSFGSSSTLGFVFQQPIFLKLNDYNDMTITPMYTSSKGLLFLGEYRTNQDFVQSKTDGSYKAATDEEENRWYINTENYFEINDIWRGKINIARTSDDTYLRLYDFDSDDPWLSSQIGIEGSFNRSYLTANMYSYQDLRDISEQEGYTPNVFPVINYKRVTEPNSIGGYFDFNINSAHIVVDYTDDTEEDETNFRTSTVLKYNQPFKTSGGQLFNLGLEARGDLFVLDSILTDETLNTYYSGTEARGNISADLTWKYPLYKSFENRTEIIEPVIEIIASPKVESNEIIPNMDSRYMELSVENLFSTDRFSGYDVFESGTRVNYGLNYIKSYKSSQELSFFLGQNYNIDVPDDIYLDNTGLENTQGFSDIVASVAYSPNKNLKFKNKIRFSSEDFIVNRNDLNMFIGPKSLNLTLNYVYLRDTLIEDDIIGQNEFNAYLSSQLTKDWRGFIGQRYDLSENRTIDFIAGLEYENDCFKFNFNVINENTRDRDYVGEQAVYFTLTFKSLGSVSTNFGVSEAN